MLLTFHKIERLNYQLVQVINTLKCKLKKGQKPSIMLFITGIGTSAYAIPRSAYATWCYCDMVRRDSA